MPKGLTFLRGLAVVAVAALPLAAVAAPHANTVVASVNGEEITTELSNRLPVTLSMAFGALLVALVLGSRLCG